MAFSRCQFHPKQSRNLLTLILVQIFLCIQDGNSPCRCWNGIAWAKDTHIYLHLFVFKQTRLTICTVSVLFIHHLIQWIVIVNLWQSGEVGYHQRYSPLGAHTRKKKFRLYGICPLPTAFSPLSGHLYPHKKKNLSDMAFSPLGELLCSHKKKKSHVFGTYEHVGMLTNTYRQLM